jgi:hypothetical protein
LGRRQLRAEESGGGHWRRRQRTSGQLSTVTCVPHFPHLPTPSVCGITTKNCSNSLATLIQWRCPRFMLWACVQGEGLAVRNSSGGTPPGQPIQEQGLATTAAFDSQQIAATYCCNCCLVPHPPPTHLPFHPLASYQGTMERACRDICAWRHRTGDLIGQGMGNACRGWGDGLP